MKGKDVIQTKVGSRPAIVFLSLVVVSTFTSLLLWCVAPPPLSPAPPPPALSADSPTAPTAPPNAAGEFGVVFHTAAPLASWSQIYIHPSGTAIGEAVGLARGGLIDHFVIGNGNGCEDGEIQMTQQWRYQQAIKGSGRNAAGCIRICVVGNFDRRPLTPIQHNRLVQLVSALQLRLHIPADEVVFGDGKNSSVGQFLPPDFRDEIQP